MINKDNRGDAINFQAYTAVDVTPDDSNDLTTTNAQLFVGTGGDIKVDMTGSGTVTYKNIADGTFLPIHVNRVYATGTTADDIIALYD